MENEAILGRNVWRGESLSLAEPCKIWGKNIPGSMETYVEALGGNTCDLFEGWQEGCDWSRDSRKVESGQRDA